MNVTLYIALAAVVGIAVGAVLHAYFSKEAVATKAEIQGWAEELRKALAADAASIRGRVETLAAKIETKL